MTQEQIAERVGKGRPTVTNALRLLELPDAIQRMVAEKSLAPGHAKVLLGLDIDQEKLLLAERVVKEGLSVRALEAVIKKLRQPRKTTTDPSGAQDIPTDHLRHINDELYQLLGTGVRIKSSRTLANGKKARGLIEIDYYSTDDLDRILSVMGYSEEPL
jgi:ParB family chromosome partitioning protein